MKYRLSFLLLIASLVFSVQGAARQCFIFQPVDDSAVDTLATGWSPDTIQNKVSAELPAEDRKKTKIGFSAYGFLPHHTQQSDRWKNIPADCRIDWHRHRKHFLWELLQDVSTFFNTFDTTYVQRDRYDSQVQLFNTLFQQVIVLTGTDDDGHRQTLTFAPAHAMKVGLYGGWKSIVLGYSFGLVPDRYKSKATEFNIAIYNSKLGFDLTYVSSHGNFNLRSAEGISGVEKHQIRGQRFAAMKTGTLALNLYYVFNYRHFSYPAAFSLSTVQLKSAGSWMLGLRYDRQQLSFDSERTEQLFKSISPKAHLVNALRIDHIGYRQIGVALGYAYNWVPARGWLVSGGLNPSIGYKQQQGESLSTQTLWKNIENFHMDFIYRFGIVHTNGRYYTGFSTVGYVYDYRHRGFQLNNIIQYFQLYVGCYFHRIPMFRGEKRK